MPVTKPNILLFTTDQQRGDHLSIAGHPFVLTPNVDSFVNHGAYFPNAYTEVPSTTAVHRIMNCGKGNYDCGLVGYSHADWGEDTFLAGVLADHGYHCLSVATRNFGVRRALFGYHSVITTAGFDLETSDYLQWLVRELGPRAHHHAHGCDANGWLARPWHLPEYCHPTNWTVDTTIEQIEKRDPTKPFFVWCGLRAPHSPYDPPQHFWDMYINRELPDPPAGDWAAKHDIPVEFPDRCTWHGRLRPEHSRRARAGYMGLCTHIDFQFGYLLGRLQRMGLLDNTLVIFTSDHGDMMGDHHLHRKTYAYEGSARVPFLIKYPKDFYPATGVFEHVVGQQDIMPTILDAAAIEIPEGCTGRSVFDAICGKPWREFIHGEHSPGYIPEESMQYLTDAKQKYIWFPLTGQEQLFDLVNDRQELHDLSGDPAWAERLKLWRARLVEILSKRPDGLADGEKLLIQSEVWGPEARGQ